MGEDVIDKVKAAEMKLRKKIARELRKETKRVWRDEDGIQQRVALACEKFVELGPGHNACVLGKGSDVPLSVATV